MAESKGDDFDPNAFADQLVDFSISVRYKCPNPNNQKDAVVRHFDKILKKPMQMVIEDLRHFQMDLPYYNETALFLNMQESLMYVCDEPSGGLKHSSDALLRPQLKFRVDFINNIRDNQFPFIHQIHLEIFQKAMLDIATVPSIAEVIDLLKK
jgi:hypothetical protein